MINKVILVGNVGADPEVRTLEGGAKVARVRLATTERIYNRQTQESKDHTEWHTITLWRGLADVADRFVRKGSQIYIEGKIRSREWTGNDGAKRYGIEIVADDLKLLGRRPEGVGAPLEGTSSYGSQQQSGSWGASAPAAGNYTPPSAPATPQPVNSADEIDDLPF
ncbi:single-stranded DNA-binding protein [Alistipes sp. OttesenSCG-928-B03]|nr:single-stranded DNA-binding protein [Alistipes sp. OttesenSCG-928-B03]